MTLTQLMIFRTVAELGSLARASAHLHKTQPALSQSIRQLEDQLRLVLFNREGYRLSLTEEGKKILQHARRILTQAEALTQVAQHLAEGNEANVNIAIEASFRLQAILPVLEEVQALFSNTQITIRQEYVSGALDAVKEGRAAIAVSPADGRILNDVSLQSVYLFAAPLVEVAAPRLLARHPNLAMSSQLREEYQIIVQDTGKGTGNVEYGVQSDQRRWYVNDFTTKKMLIESGMGWGRLPDYLAESGLATGHLQQLVLQDKPPTPPVRYHALRLTQTVPGPVAAYFWRRLQEYQGGAAS